MNDYNLVLVKPLKGKKNPGEPLVFDSGPEVLE